MMNLLQDVYFSNLNAVSNLGGFLSVGKNGSWTYGLHRFEQNKFYFVTKGSCFITIEGKTYHANAGDWFFIPAGVLHNYANCKGAVFEKYWMHFDLYPNNDLFNILSLPYFVQFDKKSNAYKLFRQYVRLYNSDSLTDKIKIKSILLQLVGEYIKLAHPDGIKIKSISETRIDSVLRYINQNLHNTITLTSLAEEFHMHPNHFVRFFKNHTGYTPVRYIRDKKLETAKRYLEASELYISEIMEKIGESDPAVFSKQFKKRYSLSPREYRKMYKNKCRI